MFLLLLLAVVEARRFHIRGSRIRRHSRRRSSRNSALDDMRGLSGTMGNIEAEVIFPRKRRNADREKELVRLLDELMVPRPENIARTVRRRGEALAQRYIDEMSDAIDDAREDVFSGRQKKAFADRAERLSQLGKLYEPDPLIGDATATIKNLIGKIPGLGSLF